MNSEAVLGITYIVVSFLLYMLPTVIAALRNHHNGGAIFVCNLILGWTVIGWCIALIWSFTSTNRKA